MGAEYAWEAVLTDEAGDQVLGPVLGGPPLIAERVLTTWTSAASFFNAEDVVPTANIEITKFDKTIPAEMREGRFSYPFGLSTLSATSCSYASS